MTFKGDVIGVETLSAVLGYLEETLDRYREKITEEQYDHALFVIQKFNTWQEGRELSAEDLYALIICNYEEEDLPYQQDLECIQIEQLNSFYGHILDGKMDTVQLYDYFCRQVCL